MPCHRLPYESDSSTLFEHFAHLPGAVFLDSGATGASRGRFDILSAAPHDALTLNALSPDMDPYLYIKEKLTSLGTLPTHPELADCPFRIGAIGYLSYDLGHDLQKKPHQAQRDIALPLAWVGFYRWSIVVDHDKKITWLIAQDDAMQARVLAWLNTPPTKFNAFTLDRPFQSDLSYADYQKAFSQLKKHIIAGDCYQANLCQRVSTTFTGDPWLAYRALRQTSPAPFSAYLKPPTGAVLSFSPERFLRVQNRDVETKPIKGTRRREADPIADQAQQADLLQSEKDRAENVMIVDLMRNDLGKCCELGSVHVPKVCALETFQYVHHLVSTVTGRLLPNQHSLDLLKACFPGGSITGAPKIRAMEILDTLEPYQRNVYCGSIGYWDISGDMDTNIAIRTLVCDDNRIHCSAGGAIVYDSDCQAEYEECFTKMGPLIAALAQHFAAGKRLHSAAPT